jgi:two-component system, chemotaxis family, protein-glutamate methylesterase/glutaminase
MITPKVSPEDVEMETSRATRGEPSGERSESRSASIRVLIVDDSPTAREAIAAILKTDPAIEIVGQAADGTEGVSLTAELLPDVITMDITMPNLNGYEATKQIMAQTPTPIVVVSSVTQAEMVHQGLNILLVGALEIVQKPGNLTAQNMEAIRAELIAKVKAVSRIKYQRDEQ